MSTAISNDQDRQSFGRRLLSELVALRTYAETKPDGRKETHSENVERVVSMHVKKFPQFEEEIRSAFSYVNGRVVLPSMRTMQFAGYAIERSNARGYNCAATNVTSFNDIADILWLSMNGCGVGFSVQRDHIRNLPKISYGNPSERMAIPDSKEGWANSIKRLLENPAIGFDYSLIREEGAKLSTGGTASGPKPLRDAHQQVRRILGGAGGRQLTSLEVHDIICHQSDAVVVGGVRRAALISLFDAWDSDMLQAKSGSNFAKNPQRQRANNSAVLYRQDPRITDAIRDVMEETFKGGFGEPGIYISNNPDMLCNPCVEIALLDGQMCVAKNTPMITKGGLFEIGDLVGKDVEIWNGIQWSTVRPVMTGRNKKLLRVHFGDGSFLDCTESHRFSVRDRFSGNFSEVKASELLTFSKYAIHVEPYKIDDSNETGIEVPEAYTLGAIAGDGFLYKTFDTDSVGVDLFAEKMDLPVLGNRNKITQNENGVDFVRVNCTKHVPYGFCAALRESGDAPIKQLFNWKRKSVLEFIAGWIDTDGSETGTGGVRLYAADEERIRTTQLLLSRFGIRSSVCLAVNGGGKIQICGRDTKRNKDLFYLQITDCSAIPTHRVDTSHGHEAKFKGKNNTILAVEELDGSHDVYCFEEKERHKAVFGNVLTFQCNLTEINAAACETPADFYHAASAAALIGTLQASYTDFPYIQGKWRKNCEAEALLGVSITGQAENWELLSDANVLREASRMMLQTNEIWARKLGINPAARIGCTKPSGSASTYLGTTPGIHGAYDDHFVRRMQIDRGSPLARYLTDVFGERDPGSNHPVEAHNLKSGLIVVSAPHAATNAIIAGKESAVDLLNRAHHIKKNWIEPSHRSGDNTHNVSLTCYYRDYEKGAVVEWMQGHADAVSGVAFFPHAGVDGMTQTPYESITAPQFDDWCGKFEGVNLHFGEINFSHAEDLREGEMACAGGSCDILMS